MAEIDLGKVVGPQGEPGIKGDTGKEGPQGPPGPEGVVDGNSTITFVTPEVYQEPQSGDSIANLFGRFKRWILNLQDNLGPLSSLKTPDKSSAVAAVNANYDTIAQLEQDVGKPTDLTTSSKEVVGAVNELNSALFSTPNWTAPTQMNGRCSITYGGYYTRNKKVCVQLTITTLVDLVGGEYRTMFAGLPIADGNRSVAISCAIFNAGFAISGYINSAGALCINAPNTITKGSEIIITGNYYSA